MDMRSISPPDCRRRPPIDPFDPIDPATPNASCSPLVTSTRYLFTSVPIVAVHTCFPPLLASTLRSNTPCFSWNSSELRRCARSVT